MESFYKNTVKINYRDVQSLGSYRKLYVSKWNSAHVLLVTKIKSALEMISNAVKEAFMILFSWIGLNLIIIYYIIICQMWWI